MELVCLADYEEKSSQVVDANNWGYYSPGACESTTVNWNSESYKKLRLMPKCLQNVSSIDLTTEVFGASLAAPLGICPTACHHLAHPDGELATARAAEKNGVIYTMSTFSSYSIEEVAAAAPNGTKWFQLYMYEDNRMSEDLVRRAEKSGFKAIVITVDSPIFRISYERLRQIRSGVLRKQRFANFDGQFNDNPMVHKFDRTLSWDRGIKSLVELTDLPIIAKGILRPEDALKAIEVGCKGIIVSNHGGRNVDTTPPSIEALPSIVEAVGGRVPIIIDGGIRMGTHILKAMAIGADLVFLGRPALWGLSVNGQEGVEHVLQLVKEEFHDEMMLCGLAKLGDIKRDLVVHESWFDEKMRTFLQSRGGNI